MIPACNNTHTEKKKQSYKGFFFVIMYVGSPVWPRSGKQASVFTSLKQSDRASFLEEVMISPLNGFSARWPRQDKQSAAGRIMAGEREREKGGPSEKRTKEGSDTPGKLQQTFRSRVRPRFFFFLLRF